VIDYVLTGHTKKSAAAKYKVLSHTVTSDLTEL